MPSTEHNTGRKHDLTFRRVVAGDAPQLRDFWLAMSPASQRTYCPYGENSHLLAPWQEASDRYAAGPDLGIIGITPQGTIVALCVVEFIGDPTRLPNFGVGVDDNYQDRGVGTQLMELILAEADKMGVPQIKLIVVNDNQRAQHLYQKFDFRFVGEPHQERDGLTYLDMIRSFPSA
jgi:ribosomal protein S18 acetylase RimI-like enzyme